MRTHQGRVEGLTNVDWKDFLLAVGGLTILATAAANIYAVFRLRTEESWKRTAEKRKAELDDVEKKNEKLEKRIAYQDAELETFTSRDARQRSQLEWYERQHGPIRSGSIQHSYAERDRAD